MNFYNVAFSPASIFYAQIATNSEIYLPGETTITSKKARGGILVDII
jgi:hypothetical protein